MFSKVKLCFKVGGWLKQQREEPASVHLPKGNARRHSLDRGTLWREHHIGKRQFLERGLNSTRFEIFLHRLARFLYDSIP